MTSPFISPSQGAEAGSSMCRASSPDDRASDVPWCKRVEDAGNGRQKRERSPPGTAVDGELEKVAPFAGRATVSQTAMHSTSGRRPG